MSAALNHSLPSSVGAVTTAGVALATSFGLLALVPLVPFYQLAFAVALGIALDVFVLRLLVVPCVLTLLGRHAAWPSKRFRNPGLNYLPRTRRKT
jgi:RND superfamily putative drug exporter